MMQDYQSLAMSYAEELSDLKCRYSNLERHCRGLENKLAKTHGRMKMYRARCKAWESALAKVDEIYWGFLGSDELMAPHKAYAAAVCAANIRKVVAPTYPSDYYEELRPKLLNRTTKPVVVFDEAAPLPEVDKSE